MTHPWSALGSGVISFSANVTALSKIETVAEKRQQLLSRPEPVLPTGVNLFDPAGETLLAYLGVRSELQDKRASHHYLRLRMPSAGVVKVPLKASLNFCWGGRCHPADAPDGLSRSIAMLK
jgi:hypothetical protein